jgi:hypothetical protein
VDGDHAGGAVHNAHEPGHYLRRRRCAVLELRRGGAVYEGIWAMQCRK